MLEGQRTCVTQNLRAHATEQGLLAAAGPGPLRRHWHHRSEVMTWLSSGPPLCANGSAAFVTGRLRGACRLRANHVLAQLPLGGHCRHPLRQGRARLTELATSCCCLTQSRGASDAVHMLAPDRSCSSSLARATFGHLHRGTTRVCACCWACIQPSGPHWQGVPCQSLALSFQRDLPVRSAQPSFHGPPWPPCHCQRGRNACLRLGASAAGARAHLLFQQQGRQRSLHGRSRCWPDLQRSSVHLQARRSRRPPPGDGGFGSSLSEFMHLFF